jgi:hypothetical protein
MPSEEQLSVDERRKYLKLVAPRYVNGGRGERSALLTEMSTVKGLRRKILLRLRNGPTMERTPRKPRLRRQRYGAAVADGRANPLAPKTTSPVPMKRPASRPASVAVPACRRPLDAICA